MFVLTGADADGSGQSVGSSVTAFPTGDYGLLDSANSSTDSFGQVTAGLTTFDITVFYG